MKFTLAFSPCPNDTFIFDALVNNKIDTKGFEIEVLLEDVQTLNQWALQQKCDISKISYGVWPLVKNNYNLLNSGGALGKGVGPLLISKKPIEQKDVNENFTVAIPGENTTAHLLFSLAFPQIKNKKFLLFNEIENAVLNGSVDAGVIIHENRFTYADKGLHKIMDLGNYWEATTKSPIPLGGIVINKKLGNETAQQIDALIKQSVEYSFSKYPDLSDFIKQHAQEMDEVVMRQHIDLYVNNYSIDLGEEGRKAVSVLEKVFYEL